MPDRKRFTGAVGAGTQVVMLNVSRKLSGSPNIKERKIDLDDAISKFRQTIVARKLSPREMGYKKNEESVDIYWPNCNFREGCKLAFDAKVLKRAGGRLSCASGAFLCQYLKLATGYDWDYDLLEAFKPHCVHTCYMF